MMLARFWFSYQTLNFAQDICIFLIELLLHYSSHHCRIVAAVTLSKLVIQSSAPAVANPDGDNGVVQGSCPKRKESRPLNSRGASLFLENYFPTDPVQADACKEHSAILANMVGACYKAAGNVMPNFLVVDFYMRSDGGGVFDALDRMNGQALCGCSSVTACQHQQEVEKRDFLSFAFGGCSQGSSLQREDLFT